MPNWQRRFLRENLVQQVECEPLDLSLFECLPQGASLDFCSRNSDVLFLREPARLHVSQVMDSTHFWKGFWAEVNVPHAFLLRTQLSL
jgi:hypothetical protein